MCFRQGTWQFMAADLVESSEIPQTLEHDLESFFWVILWVVMTRVPTNWTDEARSILINETMSPKVYSHTGGTVKENWLVATSLKKFKTPTSPSLGEFVKVLLKSVSARYREPPSPTTGASDPFLLLGQPKPNPSTEQVQEVQVGLKFLKSHWTLLEQFESALNHEWPPNDEARLMGIMQPDSVVNYSTKRARSAVGAKGGFDMEESASKRRAGEC
jgi:Fungal protein kinase